MNKAIAQNIALMPPPFSDGLDVWSNQNGTPNSTTYANSNNAQVLFTDPDFEECLEIVTNRSPQKLRFTGQTPTLPGCYLRVSARVKVVSGIMPSFEIAAFPADSSGDFVSNVTEKGPQISATEYDKVYEVSAIYGSGGRPGVDCVWGLVPVYGHFGLNVVGGGNGSSVRIESIQIEDVTSAYLRVMMDWVDVRDYGARGDGVFNNKSAFEAADAAANGRQVLVPEGDYFISGSIDLSSRFRFEGRILQGASNAFNLRAGLKISSYIDAFKDEQMALEKALHALVDGADHNGLDLEGRDINLDHPVDVRAAIGQSSSSSRIGIHNGRLVAKTSGDWPRRTVTSVCTNFAGGTTLTNVTNIENIEPGMLIAGFGVGREVYVRDVDVPNSLITLSAPFFAGQGPRTYTFTRFSYLLDFSGCNFISNFELSDMTFDGVGVASCILMPPSGFNWRIFDSWFVKPRDRGITNHGSGDFALTIEHCEFVSNEENLPNISRSTIALNCNSNDQRIRHNRGSRFRHFCVLGTNNTMFHSNHIYQGLDGDSTRLAAIIFTTHKVNATITGNYVDNCWIEWSGEHAPSNTSSSVYGSMTIDGNIFFAANVPDDFTFINMAPYANSQTLIDFTITDNTFRVTGGSINRVEGINTDEGTLNPNTLKNIKMTGNVYDGVTHSSSNPVRKEGSRSSSSPSSQWLVSGADELPFDGQALGVDSVVATSRIRTSSNSTLYVAPYVSTEQSSGEKSIRLFWPEPVHGSVVATFRCDRLD